MAHLEDLAIVDGGRLSFVPVSATPSPARVSMAVRILASANPPALDPSMATALLRAWDPRKGLFSDPRSGLPDELVSHSVIVALAAVDPAQAYRSGMKMLPALERRASARHLGIAAQLFVARLLVELRVIGIDRASGILRSHQRCRTPVADEVSMLSLMAAQVEIAGSSGRPCKTTPRWQREAEEALANTSRLLPDEGQAPVWLSGSLLSVAALESAGALPSVSAGAYLDRAWTRVEASGAPTIYGLSRPVSELLAITEAAGIDDHAFAISEEDVEALQRLVRWGGRLPDIVQGDTAIQDFYGALALARLRAVSPGDLGAVPSTSTTLDGLRFALAASTPGIEDLDEGLALTHEDPRSHEPIMLTALLATRVPDGCSVARRWVGAMVARALRWFQHTPPARRAPSALLAWAAVLSSSEVCRIDARDAAEVRRELIVTLRARVSGPALSPRNPGEMLITAWMRAEAWCLTSTSDGVDRRWRPIVEAASRNEGGAAGPGGSFDLIATYAAIRLSEIGERGCANAWWEGSAVG